MSELKDLIRKEVVVSAAGTEYRGTLIEVTEHEVLLKTPRGWTSVQMSRVNNIRGADETQSLMSNRFIDPSFYDPEAD